MLPSVWNVTEVLCFPSRSRNVNVCRVSDPRACNISLPMSEAWIRVLSCRSRNISQKRRNRLRRSKKVSYKYWGFRHRHTRDSQGWQHCVVIPSAKRIAGRMGKVDSAKECVVPRQRTEGGRTKFRQVLRYYLYKCNAVYYLLPSRLIRFPFSQKCIPFNFPRFLCITHSARHARDVIPNCAAHH
jgi:hypothetical protein